MTKPQMLRWVGNKWFNCANVDELKDAILLRLQEINKSYDGLSMASSLACAGDFLRILPIIKAIEELESDRLIFVVRRFCETTFHLRED